MKNTFNILTADGESFYPEVLFKCSPYSRNDFTGEMSIEEAGLDILQVVEGLDLTVELFHGDKDAALLWFNSPNEALSGETPFDLCIQSRGQGLLKWLKERLGKQ